MFDFLFIGYWKRLKNRLNVRSFVRIILNNNININVENEIKNTPLFTAIINDNKEIVKLLIEKGADCNYKNKNDNTKATYCCSKYPPPCLFFFLLKK